MTELNFRTDKLLPFFDKSLGAHIDLLAEWTVEADTDDGICKTSVPLYTSTAMNDVLAGLDGNCGYDELSGKIGEISNAVSEKLTAQTGYRCTARLVELKPDERSAKFIEQRELMKKMSDPAYAAAELEKAMKKAQETAMKNGMTLQDIENIKNMPLPDLPPLPDTDDPLERARAVTAHFEQIKQMASGAPVSASPRPKFCEYCGSALPVNGNFCPNCGAKIKI